MPNNTYNNGSFSSTRTFGVEVEFIGSRELACRVVNEAGITCEVERYGHSTPRNWKVVTDASIGRESGGELVSPILTGSEGLAAAKKAIRALSAAGLRINRECGVHVHVGAADLNPHQVKNVLTRYSKHETSIDDVMPRSRRDNEFCRGLSNVISSEYFARPTTMATLFDSFGHGRYFKVNLMAWNRQQTVEFRQHAGSLNGTKIGNWIQFCVNFVEISKLQCTLQETPPVTLDATPARVRTPRSQSKKARLIRLLTSGWNRRRSAARFLGTSEATVSSMISNLRRDGYTIIRQGSRGWHSFMIQSYPNSEAFIETAERNVAWNLIETERNTQRSLDRVRNMPPVEIWNVVAPDSDNAFSGLPTNLTNWFSERAQDLSA